MNFADKLQLFIKRKAKPPMKHLKIKIKYYIRYFYPNLHCEQFKWLMVCENMSTFLCWSCLLLTFKQFI